MIKDEFERYIGLMKIAYPNSTRRALSGQTPKHVIVDDFKTFKAMNNYQRNLLMSALEKQIRNGIRSLPDKDNDDFIIKKKGIKQ